MADGAKGTVGQIVRDVGEVVAKPLTDQVGKAIESGVQTVVSGPPQPKLTPQPFGDAQVKQKQVEDQAKLQEARRKIAWWKNLDEAQRKVREEQKQLQLQNKQQEETQKQQVKQFEIQKKKQPLPEEVRARNLAERKMGRGLGG